MDSTEDGDAAETDVDVGEPVSGTVAGGVLTVRLEDGSAAPFRR